MCSPGIERSSLLLCPVMPLINACDTTTGVADMTKHCFCDLEPHTQALQPGSYSAPQIVQAERHAEKPTCHHFRIGSKAQIKPLLGL